MSESELCAANRDAVAALARLRTAEQSASNGELLEQLKANRRLRRQLDHSDVRIIAGVKAGGGFTERGVHPAPAVADLVGCGRGRSRRLVGLAERLFPSTSLTGEPLPPTLPATATAWDGYEIDQAHAEVIDRTLSTSAAERLDPDRRARLEVQLADLARTYPAYVLAGLGQELLEALDQDGAEPDRELDAQVNELFLSPDGDGVGGRVKGRLDSVTFDALRQAINGVIKPKADEGKSFGQRQADALGEICEHVLDGGHLPDVCGEKPHLTVTVSHEQLRRQLHGGSLTATGLRIGPKEIRRLACDSKVIAASSADAASPSMSDGNTAPPPSTNAVLWPPATVGAPTRVALVRRTGAPRTTSSIGSTVGLPISTTWCCCAWCITGCSTNPAPGSLGESHPQAPTERNVTVSRHSALLT